MPSEGKDILSLYAELMQAYRQHMLNFCWDHSANPAEADMLLVAVTNDLLRSVGTLRPDSTPRQRFRWLQRVMRHAYADYRTKSPGIVPLSKVPDIAVETDEEAELVNAMLQHLSDDERSFVEERLQGYKPQEQASMHHISCDAVYQRHHRILMKLRTIYAKYYE